MDVPFVEKPCNWFSMMQLNIVDETSPLKAVILGIAKSSGPVPSVEEAYDPKSLEHIKAGTYPKEADMIQEMDAFEHVLDKYGVQVFRPEVLENCNQIFARDIAFVIEDKLFHSNVLPDRVREFVVIHGVL